MLFLRNGSIRKSLTTLVIFALLPAFAILLYTGLEHRQQTIKTATQQVTLIARSMAEQLKEITRSTQRTPATLSLPPDIKQLNIAETSRILSDVVKQNPDYKNLALVALDGNVITSGTGPTKVNLADRKHFKEALSRKEFVVGEFIISRIDTREPVFPSAIPVLDNEGNPLAVLTIVHRLSSFSQYLDTEEVPAGSFVAVTDHKGIRMYH